MSLLLWLGEISSFNGQVEVIVSDNASTDRTAEVILEQKDQTALRYFRNATNIGFRRNAERLTSLAKGQFIWLVGDDDLPMPGCIARLLPILKTSSKLALVVVNYKYWEPKATPSVPFRPESIDAKIGFNLCYDGFVACIGDVIEGDLNSLTNIYASVWPAHEARAAFKIVPEALAAPFTSRQSILPHSTYIAQNLNRKPGYFLSEPALLASFSVSWSEFMEIYLLRWLPENIDLFVANGVPKSKVTAYKRSLIQKAYRMMWTSMRSRGSLKLVFSTHGFHFFIRNRYTLALYTEFFCFLGEIIERLWRRLQGNGRKLKL